jgi:hypothetical protein
VFGTLTFIFVYDVHLLILFCSFVAEYNIMMFDSKQKERTWNITFCDYSSDVMDAEALNNYGTKLKFKTTESVSL